MSYSEHTGSAPSPPPPPPLTYRQFISPYISPCIICCQSPTVTSVLHKNNISHLSTLLQPYAYNIDSHTGLNIRSSISTSHTASVIPSLSGTASNAYTATRAYSLTDYSLYFAHSQHVRAVDNDTVEKHLLSTLYQPVNTTSTPTLPPDQVATITDIPPFLHRRPLHTSLPHYNKMVNELMYATRFSAYDTVSQPIACVLCCTTYDTDLPHAIESAIHPSQLTDLFHSGAYDVSAIPKVVLLLHDRHNTQPIDLQDTVSKLTVHAQRLYGYDTIVRLLELNSLPQHQPNIQSVDQWQLYETRAQNLYQDVMQYTTTTPPHHTALSSPPQPANTSAPVDPLTYMRNSSFTNTSSQPTIVRGQYLSETDHLHISNFISDLCTKSIIPSIERRIAVLHERVAHQRKGLKNQLRALFGRKTMDKPVKPSYDPSTQLYDLTSIEYQTCLLGNLCMLVQDYDNAAVYHKLFISDCKHDNAAAYYTNTNELLSIALSCMATPTTIQAYDIAFNNYTTVSPFRSVRTAVHHTYYYTTQQQYLAAADAMVKAAEKVQNGVAGCLLEYGAYCYLSAQYVRKYAFHVILAANLYSKQQQLKYLSNRCYLTGLHVYNDKQYYYINVFVHYNIARNYYYFGAIEQCVQHYSMILQPRNESAKNGQFFNEMCYIVSDSVKHNKVHDLVLEELNVPLIDPASVSMTDTDMSCQMYNFLPMSLHLTQLRVVADDGQTAGQNGVTDGLTVDIPINTKHTITVSRQHNQVAVGVSYCINQILNVRHVFKLAQPPAKRAKLHPK